MKETLEPNDPESTAENTSLLSDKEFLEALRLQMLKFATVQLSDSHLAEDAVQEALIGALKNAKSFGGRAALKTWVFAILKNKIADALRQKQRLVYAGSLMRDDEEDEEDEDFRRCLMPRAFGKRMNAPWLGPTPRKPCGKVTSGASLRSAWNTCLAIRRASS